MNFKTKAGTELPISNLRGKDYLEVKYRLVWFREEHPDWPIETEIIEMSDKHAVAKAVVKNQDGRILSTGHKHEDKQGFADYREKAETGAIGRALAHIGYGTQFAPDLDEGERLADSPVDRKPRSRPTVAPPTPPKVSEAKAEAKAIEAEFVGTNAGPTDAEVQAALDFRKPVGNLQNGYGKMLRELSVASLSNDLKYWEDRLAREGKPAQGKLADYLKCIRVVMFAGKERAPDDEIPF